MRLMGIRAFTGSLTLTSAGDLIEPVEGLVSVIDMERASFVDVFAIVLVAMEVGACVDTGVDLEFVTPSDTNVGSYLARMRLGSFFSDSGVTHGLPTIQEHGQEGYLLPLTRCSGRDYEGLAELLYERLSVHGGTDPEVLNETYEAVIEVGQNAMEHSQSGGMFVAAQTYLRNTRNAYVVGAIGDLGVGLRRTLRRHAPRSDQHAVTLAVTEGISGLDDPYRGMGLHSVVESCRLRRGVVVLRSGTALRTIYRANQSRASVEPLPGTLVGFKMPLRPGKGRTVS